MPDTLSGRKLTIIGLAKIDFQDTRFQLHQQMNVEYEKCPTAAHHMHGKVERKIRQIKESIVKTIMNERLSILQWEL